MFGSDQSGSQDIGIDLQSQLLSTTLATMRANSTLMNQIATQLSENAHNMMEGKSIFSSTDMKF